jgi:hypothetical protein
MKARYFTTDQYSAVPRQGIWRHRGRRTESPRAAFCGWSRRTGDESSNSPSIIFLQCAATRRQQACDTLGLIGKEARNVPADIVHEIRRSRASLVRPRQGLRSGLFTAISEPARSKRYRRSSGDRWTFFPEGGAWHDRQRRPEACLSITRMPQRGKFHDRR